MLATLGAVLALAAAPAVAQDKKTICFVTFSLQIAYFQSSVAGGKRAAEELGVELVVLDPQADAARQVTLMEDCIARKVNAIVLDPIESGSVMGPINEAGARGHPDRRARYPDQQPLRRHAGRRATVRRLARVRSVRGRLRHRRDEGRGKDRRSCWPRPRCSSPAATASSRH